MVVVLEMELAALKLLTLFKVMTAETEIQTRHIKAVVAAEQAALGKTDPQAAQAELEHLTTFLAVL